MVVFRDKYLHAWGKDPKGQGCWAFKVNGKAELVYKNMGFGAALQELRKEGFKFVEVQS